jgi:predicted phosphodiesterase
VINIKRILAISDIHGCLDEFNELLEKVKYNQSEDQLILLGDYIDRGLKSKQVVEKVMEYIMVRLHYEEIMMKCFWNGSKQEII